MSDPVQPQATAIPQTGTPTWQPSAEDDANPIRTPRKQRVRDIFFGADGLRAGWSLLLFALLARGFEQALVLVLRAVQHGAPSAAAPHTLTAWSTIRNDYTVFILLALCAWLVSLVERRGFGRYGIELVSTHRMLQFGMGAALGFGLLALLVFALHLTGLIALDGAGLHGLAALKHGLLWFIAFLGVGLAEEFATRGFVQFTLTRGLAGLARIAGISYRSSVVVGFWTTAVLFSAYFGFGHKGNPGESPVGLFSAALIGMVFAFSLWRTGSLWWAIGFHAAWDWAQSFLFGTPDSGLLVQHNLLASHPVGNTMLSGGLTGPEGSLFVVGAILIATLTVYFALPPEPGSCADPTWTPNDIR